MTLPPSPDSSKDRFLIRVGVQGRLLASSSSSYSIQVFRKLSRKHSTSDFTKRSLQVTFFILHLLKYLQFYLTPKLLHSTVFTICISFLFNLTSRWFKCTFLNPGIVSWTDNIKHIFCIFCIFWRNKEVTKVNFGCKIWCRLLQW